MLLGEVIWIRLKHGLLDLGSLLGVPVLVLASHIKSDLVLNFLLLSDQIRRAHNFFVKKGGSLLQGWLQEPLAHLLDDFIGTIGVQACEFDPLAKETWAHLDPVSQVESVVLSAAED